VKKLLTLLVFGAVVLPLASAQTMDDGESVENITLQMEFATSAPDKITIDGTEWDSSQTDYSLSYGYIVNASPVGIVSYDGEPIQASFESGESISLTQERGEFLVPNTRGGNEVVEARQNLVQSRSFMSEINPSFGFTLEAERIIRVSYKYPYKVHEVRGPSNGIQTMLIQNRIHSGGETQLVLDTE